MSKLRKIIRMMLCLPMAPIIGVGGVGGSGSGSDSGNNNPNNTDNNSDNTNNDSNNNSDSNNNQDQGKTFTQAEVNRMMKAEKESGRRSILKELGVEDVKSTKEALEKYQKYLDSQKSDLEKANENLNETQAKLTSAENRANKAEFCLKAIAEFEANPKSVDDLVAIAMTKVTDDKDIATVLKEMKENEAYNGFFAKSSSSSGSSGTGNPLPKGKSNNNGSESYGARLAQQKLARNNFNKNKS